MEIFLLLYFKDDFLKISDLDTFCSCSIWYHKYASSRITHDLFEFYFIGFFWGAAPIQLHSVGWWQKIWTELVVTSSKFNTGILPGVLRNTSGRVSNRSALEYRYSYASTVGKIRSVVVLCAYTFRSLDYKWHDWWIMTWKGRGRESPLYNLRYSLSICLKGLRKTTNAVSQEYRCSDWDSNWFPFRCTSEVCSVRPYMNKYFLISTFFYTSEFAQETLTPAQIFRARTRSECLLSIWTNG